MSILLEREKDGYHLSNGVVTLDYRLGEGTCDIRGFNGFSLKRLHSGARLADGVWLDTREGGQKAWTEEIQDAFGKGYLLRVETAADNDRTLLQQFLIYDKLPYLMMETFLKAKERIGSNEILVYEAETFELPASEDPRFLFTPFDNDDFVRYAALPLKELRESYEVGAVYDAVSRNGFVTGSVTHDLWKTGITAQPGEGPVLEGFRVVSGVTSRLTRDTLPHGTVFGTSVGSARIFLGFYEDYRDGLEAYGKANGVMAPPLKWDHGVPVGWNSWAAVATEIDYRVYTGASDFVKESLETQGFQGDEKVYINFDSFWNSLSEEELMAAAKHVHGNGQIPGIYTTPFTFWGGTNTEGEVPGTNGQYRWKDILLKDSEGNILPPIDGGYCIDPTHPGNLMRVERELTQFKKWGFEYVKMDFMAHGAVEGVHYDPSVTTGIAAYNYGMQQIDGLLANELKEQKFYISLSIAPLFPAQYAHGRRVSCDVFGTIDWTEYMLNSLSYGWWINGNVYRFNDPDHIVLYNSFNHREPSLFNEGLSRYVSAAIAGTMMLDSDDFRDEAARERAASILPNREIMEVAKAGRSFRPVEGNTGEGACDCFVRREGEDSLYLAVFNFSNTEKKRMELSLPRLGLEEKAAYHVRDLWSKEESLASGTMTVLLEEAQPRIFLLKKQAA